MAVLTAILAPNLMGARERSRDAKRKQELNSMKTALRMYFNDWQSYPDSGGVWITNVGLQVSNYMPGAAGLGYTYFGVGDSFWLKAATEATIDEENAASQTNCGVGITESGYFYVCGR